MRQSGSPTPIAAYTIPPHAPPAVTEAKAEFDAVATRWAETKGDLQDAKEALVKAKTADIRAVVDAAEQGRDVEDAQAHEREAQTKLDDLQVRLRGFGIATDEAGNRLAQAIAQHRDQWLPLLAKAEAEAANRFDEAVAEAQAALTELRPARGARTWVATFDAGQAQVGHNPQFSGGRLRVIGEGVDLRGEFDPVALLALASLVTVVDDEPAAPGKRKQVATRA